MTDPVFTSARPSFRLNGNRRADLEPLLLALLIDLPLHGSAHGEVRFTNWGIRDSASTPDFVLEDIALGDELEILVGEDNPATLFKGEITALEEGYGNSTAPTLVLLVQDKLHRLARRRQSRSYEDQSATDVVRRLAADAGLQADVNLPGLTATWHQLNESDLAFLLRLAGRFATGARLNGTGLRVRPEESDPDPLPLCLGDRLLRTRLIADLNHQPARTRVAGYNLADDTATDHSSSRLDPAPAGTSAIDTLNHLGWTSDEIVPQPFARSSAEAEALASAHLRRQGERFLSGELVCSGEPRLGPGREIDLSGVSPRLCGRYRVVHCVHRFDNENGFETHLSVQRGGWQP